MGGGTGDGVGGAGGAGAGTSLHVLTSPFACMSDGCD